MVTKLSQRRVRRRCCAAMTTLLFAGQGCGSNDSTSNPPSGPTPDPLFTDAKVPRCDRSKFYKFAGQLEGQTIQVATALLSNLEPQRVQILEVVAGQVREDLGLTWSVPLAENAALPLNGGQIRIPDDQPLGGRSFCVTGGKFGSPTPAGDGGEGRQLLFQITAGNDCMGANVSIALSGCIWRSTSYFPVRPTRDAASD